MFTRLFESKRVEIVLSLLSIILLTYLAFDIPFFNFDIILGLEVAVKAVSEPDKKPEIKIKIIIIMNKRRFRKVINELIY